MRFSIKALLIFAATCAILFAIIVATMNPEKKVKNVVFCYRTEYRCYTDYRPSEGVMYALEAEDGSICEWSYAYSLSPIIMNTTIARLGKPPTHLIGKMYRGEWQSYGEFMEPDHDWGRWIITKGLP